MIAEQTQAEAVWRAAGAGPAQGKSKRLRPSELRRALSQLMSKEIISPDVILECVAAPEAPSPTTATPGGRRNFSPHSVSRSGRSQALTQVLGAYSWRMPKRSVEKRSKSRTSLHRRCTAAVSSAAVRQDLAGRGNPPLCLREVCAAEPARRPGDLTIGEEAWLPFVAAIRASMGHTAEERRELEQVFNKFDVNRSNSICMVELNRLFTFMGYVPKKDMLESVLRQARRGSSRAAAASLGIRSQSCVPRTRRS